MKAKRLCMVMLLVVAFWGAASSEHGRRFAYYLDASKDSCSISTWERLVYSIILS